MAGRLSVQCALFGLTAYHARSIVLSFEQATQGDRMKHALGLAVAVAAACVLSLGTAIVAQSDWSAPTGRDFPVVGGNLGNQRYSTLSQITPANLTQLGGAWLVHLE